MRRNENQVRPTAGCLSVPLFNQKKRSRLPLTSNPSESEMCSGTEYRDMLSFPPISHPSSCKGNAQVSTHRAPLTQWNQQANLRPQHQQPKAWPSASPGYAGRGYTVGFQKSTCPQAEPQRPPGRQNSMATTQHLSQDEFPSGTEPPLIRNKPFTSMQPIKQQTSRNTNPTQSSLILSHPAVHSQRPAAQSQSSQWAFKAVGKTGGGKWVEDTFGTSRSEKCIQQQQQKFVEERAKPATRKSLRILTAVIEGMKHWSQFKDKVPMMFEIFATLDSAVTMGKFGAKNFLIKDGKDVVPCVYYENDQVLPRLIRGQVHRCVGNYDREKNLFTCVSVRAASPSEQRNAQEAVRASDGEMRSLVQALSEI